MILIPLHPVPAQAFKITLGTQDCALALYKKGAYFYLDLAVDGVKALQGRMVLNRVWVVRYAYLGLSGDLVMLDTTGTNDLPTYDDLGSRYKMYYLDPSELAAQVTA